mgnify:CR=1 FL=1
MSNWYQKLIAVFFLAFAMSNAANALELTEPLVYRGLRSEPYNLNFKHGVDDDFDSVILLVTGPKASAVIWKKEKKFGLWLNRKSYSIPYYNTIVHAYSSAPLDNITSPYNLSLLNLDNLNQDRQDELYKAFLKEQYEKNFFHEEVSSFTFEGDLLGKQITLPANIPTGQYRVYLYLFQDKNLVSAAQSGFYIKNNSFLYRINRLANSYPLLYSILAIMIALGLGAKAAYLVPLLKKARRR